MRTLASQYCSIISLGLQVLDWYTQVCCFQQSHKVKLVEAGIYDIWYGLPSVTDSNPLEPIIDETRKLMDAIRCEDVILGVDMLTGRTIYKVNECSEGW